MTDMERWLQADILSLGMAADEARRRQGTAVTYLRVHVVGPADLAGELAVPDQAAEVRLHEIPEARDEALAQLTRLRAAAGRRPVVAYSMADLQARAGQGWGPLDELLRRLVAAGLTDVAEMPVDRLADLARSVRALADAGATPRRLTTSTPAAERRLEMLARVRQVREALAGPLYYAPLPRQVPVDRPTTGYDDLRSIALARLGLALSGAATHIEVDWSLYGAKLSQVALTFGADHLDAVAASDDTALGRRRTTVADVERNIRAAGFEPREERPTS